VTALLLCGGHGLLLALGLYKGGFVAYPERLGGRIGMAAVGWLVLSGPLAALALALRARLQRSPLVWPLALCGTAMCVASFAYYLATIVASRR
jgi:hypothetical protein